MSEPGRPLIPRELLPAPVELVRRAKRPPAQLDGTRQLSIFGAETTEPSPADLAGLLVGPGRLGRMGGTARVSVVVDAAWRVHVLVGELVARGLVVSWLSAPEEDQEQDGRDVGVAGDLPDGRDVGGVEDGRDVGGVEDGQDVGDARDVGVAEEEGGNETEIAVGDSSGARDRPGAAAAFWEVRTAYSSRLTGLARAWPPPADRLFLSGPRLRLWVAAAGRPVPGGYALGLDPVDNPAIADSALVRAGLAGTVSDHGRHYSISGRKRLRRLAELVGERPAAAPAELWPTGAAA